MKRTSAVSAPLLVTLALLLAGCGRPTQAAGGSAVGATLSDSGITLTSASMKPGKVTITIENHGSMTHEFEVFKTDLSPDALPVENGVVSDEGLTQIDEAEDIAPGTSASLALDLKPGKYVSICNLPGHYQLGMHVGFTVG